MLRAGPADAASLVELVSSTAWVDRAAVLKHDDRSSVLRGDSPLGPVVIKSVVLDRPKDALARFAGRTRHLRQWRGAALLSSRGIATPEPLLLWRGRGADGRLIESLALRFVPGRTVIELLARDGLSERERIGIARVVGELVGCVIRAGLFNRDQKPSNILCTPPTPQSPFTIVSPVILDPVGVRRSGSSERARTAARRRMLFSLIVEPLGLGIDPGVRLRLEAMHACARALGLPRSLIRGDFRAIDQMLFEHGDPSPEVNPLPGSAE